MNATELIAQLREYANNPGYSHGDYADTMRQAVDFIAESKSNLRDQLRQQGNTLEAMRERAEKAEAELEEWRFTNKIDELQHAHDTLLAARKTPDLSTLHRYDISESGPCFAPNDGSYVLFDDLQALLAKPLQQEGWKEVPAGYAIVPDYRGYAHLGFGQYLLDNTVKPDQAELVISVAKEHEKVGKVVGGLYLNTPDRVVQPKDMAVRIRFGNVSGLDALEQQLRLLRDEHFPESQPPDKLQQASTAQAGPTNDLITIPCPSCDPNETGCDECSGQGSIIVSRRDMEAASATDAGQSTVKPVILEQMRDLASQHKMALVPLHVTRAMQEVMDDDGWAWEDLLGAAEAIADDEYAEIVQGLGGLQSRIDQLETLLAATPAQATPEGGQDQAQEAYYFRHLTLCAQGQGFTGITDALNEISNMRAALAASQQAAEPVLWIDADAAPHEDHGELIDGARQIALLGSTKGPFGHYTTPLYRAAPPQQVDTSGLPG